MKAAYKFKTTEYPLIHCELTGLWDDESLSDDLYREFIDAIQKMQGRPFVLIAEMQDFKPFNESIKEKIGASMNYAVENGLFKAIEVLPSGIQRLGLKMAEEKSGKSDFRIVVNSSEQAMVEFDKLKPELEYMFSF